MYQIITDMKQADALWEAGVLYLTTVSGKGPPHPEQVWLHLTDYADYNIQTMAPSTWKVPTGCVAYYALKMED